MLRWWRRLGSAERTAGRPTSSNRASSLHLGWQDVGEAAGASVVLEVLEAPAVPELYFWALQVDLAGPSGPAGGAHLGLQWYPPHPGATAVNWGGYRHGGGELDGSVSTLPSATANPNTRDFAWVPRRRYRLAVRRTPGPAPGVRAWRGEVTDLATDRTVVVRELFAPADRVDGVVVWSEVFARCDDPPVAVRWSEPVVERDEGDRTITTVSVSYQAVGDGGCSNTDSSSDAVGIVQRTSTERTTPHGAVLGTGGGIAPGR